jgi:hypothetical protein
MSMPTRLAWALVFAAAACTPAANPPAAAGGGGASAAGTGGASAPANQGGGGGNTAGSGGTASTSGGASGSGGGAATAGTGGSAGTGGTSPVPPDATGDAAGADTDPSADGNPADPYAGKPFPPGPHKVVVLMGDPNVNDDSRSQMMAILASMKATHGIEAVEMGSNDATATSVAGAALVIAGPNNNYCVKSPDPSLKGLAIPIMVSRDCKTTELGLGHTLNTQNYTEGLPVKMMIPPDNARHPLAAGLSGVVPVMKDKCRLVRADGMGPGAVLIGKPMPDATPVSANSWTIAAYEKGAEMVGGFKAPAKRMIFFWHRPSAVTAEGEKLFRAAVEWMIRP